MPVATVLWALVTSFAPLAGLIGAALGSIIFGLATPSEAAAMGSLGALLLAVGYGADYQAAIATSSWSRSTACWPRRSSSI